MPASIGDSPELPQSQLIVVMQYDRMTVAGLGLKLLWRPRCYGSGRPDGRNFYACERITHGLMLYLFGGRPWTKHAYFYFGTD
jgi:hypothetical protein